MAFRSRRSSFARNLKSLDPEYVDYEMDAGLSAADKNQWFFEVGWEVANKGELSGTLREHKSYCIFLVISQQNILVVNVQKLVYVVRY